MRLTLKRYITDGFALNESRLRSDPNALRDLAAQVRALRSEEKTIYEAVRDCYKVASIDYDKDSPKVRSFYARLQDKFLFAITGKTASELILDRADAAKHNMGLTSMKGNLPTKADAKTGKNFLHRDEIYVLHILCEQFLLYAESRAIRGKSMTMDDLALKLDELLKTNDYPVFNGYRDYLKDRAMEHAETEWKRFQKMLADGSHLPASSSALS
ncbi:RhuM family protein [Sphingobium sp. AN641]|uniref:RhuM family protein n=1 Tax=Sphingobium sp. AN641 TaxID=3133443 RepID=UPI0030C033A7